MSEPLANVLAHVEPEEAPAARAVVTHHTTHAAAGAGLGGAPVGPFLLQPRRPPSHAPQAPLPPLSDDSRHRRQGLSTETTNPVHRRRRSSAWDDPLDALARHPRLHEIVESVGTGFLYGTLFGSVLAVVEGYRESPQHQRLRGILHHGKHVLPATAGRIAVVTGLFRVASWGLDAARGRDSADLWTVLLAAPLAGALLRVRQGARAAAHTAFTFGSVGAVMVLFNVAQARVSGGGRHRHHHPPGELLEEIAFAEEVDEVEVEIEW